MECNIKKEGVLEFKTLTMSGKTFKQIERVTANKDGKLIGYILDDYQMTTFIGKENGKLYQTRQDSFMDTLIAQGIDVTFANLFEKIAVIKAGLPQIFLK